MRRSALLIVTESRSGNANSHSISCVDDAEDRRLPEGRGDLEMNIENAAKFVRRRQARKEVLRDPRRHAEDQEIVGAEFPLCPVKVERNGALALENGRP